MNNIPESEIPEEAIQAAATLKDHGTMQGWGGHTGKGKWALHGVGPVAPYEDDIRKLECELRELRKSEQELSDAYLRIRELVEAWETSLGGANRFEITEAAIRKLITP